MPYQNVPTLHVVGKGRLTLKGSLIGFLAVVLPIYALLICRLSRLGRRKDVAEGRTDIAKLARRGDGGALLRGCLI